MNLIIPLTSKVLVIF